MSMYIHKALLTYKYLRNVAQKRPISVNLEITKRCNATCDFCDYWKTTKENVIDDYGPVLKPIDPMMVNITGGEPLLRTNLPEIIRGIKRAVPISYVAMITNGSLMTIEKAKELKKAGLNQISFSVDSLDEQHDKSRGIPGLWKHLESLIPQVAKLGFDSIGFNWIIMEENFSQTLLAAEKAREWGVRISYTSYCDLKNMNDTHYLSEENLSRFPGVINQILQFKRQYKNVRSSDYFLSLMPRYYGHDQIDGCPAGLRWVQITPEGWYKPCSELPPVVFWKDYDHRKSFQQQECTLCWYGCRGEAQTPVDLKRIREFL
ncbi:MAG TPA: radical SAM protein [Bdellovibrionota bacterium]|nr:radical SAM protein [Bdellovibrionota bacterium]